MLNKNKGAQKTWAVGLSNVLQSTEYKIGRHGQHWMCKAMQTIQV